MKKPFVLLLLSLFVADLVQAQGVRFHGKLQNSIYSYESDEAHTRFYQYAQFTAATANQAVQLNGSLRALSESNASLDNDQRFKAYAINLMIKKLLQQRLDVTIGRQFLHPGAVLGGLDGVAANMRFSPKWSVQVYGGVESGYLRDLTVDDRLTWGGVVKVREVLQSDVQILFMNKSQDSETLWQLAGLNLINKSISKTLVRAEAHLDLKNSALHRLLLNGRTAWNEKLSTVLEYKMQQPRVYANSYFTIFELEPYQHIRAAATYQLTSALNLEGQYRGLMMEDGSANQLLLALQNHHGSLGFILERGDSGDQTGLMFDYAFEVLPRLLASVYIDYSKYRTETIYAYDDQLANAVRCSYQISRNWNVDLEYQWLRNRFKDNDSRILNHISFRW